MPHEADNYCWLIPVHYRYYMYSPTLGASNGTRSANPMLKAPGHLAKIEVKVPKNDCTECDPSQFGKFFNFFFNFSIKIFFLHFLTIFQLIFTF